jgi:hypothetical protein
MLRLRVGAEHMSLLPGRDPSTWGWAVYARTSDKGRWLRALPDTTVEQIYDPRFVIGVWSTADGFPSRRIRVQFQVRFHASIDATYDEHLSLDTRLLTRP